MASSDQTQTAVLGALSVMPMTGYALREEIRDTLGHFWGESFGQIYPALTELEREGMVQREAGGGRSSRFVITDAGIARLRGLLSEPPQPPRPRNGVMLRLFFGRQLGPEACIQLVLDAKANAEAQLAAMQAARRELEQAQHLANDLPYILLTISGGEHGARAAIAWADEALATLESLSPTDTRDSR